MAKMVWVAVGAAGGIYAYRKSTAAWEQVRGNGVVNGAQVATAAAASVLGSMRSGSGSTQVPEQPALVSQSGSGSVLAARERVYAPDEASYEPVQSGLRVGRFRITRTDGT